MKKIILTVFTLILCLVAAACSNVDEKPVGLTGIKAENYKSTKEFRIFADRPSTPYSEQGLADYLASGMNIYLLGEDYSEFTDRLTGQITEQYKNALKAITATGADIFIRNQYNHPDYFSNKDAEKKFKLYGGDFTLFKRDITTQLNEYKAIKGYYMADEPVYSHIPTLVSLAKWKNANAPDSFFHVNLFPSYASGTLFGGHTWNEYIQYYVDTVLVEVNGEKSLCIDHYPLRSNANGNYISEAYLTDLLTTANIAKEYNARAGITSKADFGLCIQAFKGVGLRDITSSADIRFQTSVGMALGAKVYEYFLYSTLDGGIEGSLVGMVSSNGSEKSPVYDHVKTANTQIKKFEEVLYSFEWQGLMTVNAEKQSDHKSVSAFADIENQTMKSPDVLSSVRSRLDAIIGIFKDNAGNNGFMIVNYNEPSANRTNYVDLQFKGANSVLVYRNGEPTEMKLSDGKIQLRLLSGEGVFAIPFNKEGN